MYTNSRLISTDTFQYGLVSYPDSYSYLERKKRRESFFLRLYFMFKEYLSKDYTIVFDTLTYDDYHLPHLSDFLPVKSSKSCFNPADIRSFNWQLRDMLPYKYKFFVASEYGSSSEYLDARGRVRVGTHRPHYHILFFIPQKIDVVDFAAKVFKAWHRGRTDNYGNYRGERSRNYVLHNTFTRESCDDARCIKLSNYVSKYCLKDAEFDGNLIGSIRSYYRRTKYPKLDLGNKKAFNHDVRAITDICCTFVRLSHGFGDGLLTDASALDCIYNRGLIQVPDSVKVLKDYNIPTYYLRKLFYELVDGSWQLNENGKQFYPKLLSFRAKRLEQLYRSVVDNSEADVQQQIYSLLDGRSLADLARYVTYYKGRIFNPALLDSLPSVDFVCSRFVSEPTTILQNDGLRQFREYFRLGNMEVYYWNDELLLPTSFRCPLRHKEYSHYDDWKRYIIDDTWFPDWYDFDRIVEIISSLLLSRVSARYDVDASCSGVSNRLFHKYGIKSKQYTLNL